MSDNIYLFKFFVKKEVIHSASPSATPCKLYSIFNLLVVWFTGRNAVKPGPVNFIFQTKNLWCVA